MLIGEAELCDYVRDVVPELRTTRFFYLALSLGKLLDMPAGAVTVEALWQLIQEYEYHFANSAMQMVRYTTARNSECMYPQLNPREEGEEEAAKANLFRFGNEVVYLHLQTPHVAFELDYREVLFSLCDVLGLLYNKFVDEEIWQNSAVFDMLVKVGRGLHAPRHPPERPPARHGPSPVTLSHFRPTRG